MEAHTAAAVAWLLATLSLPSVGLPAIFIVSLVSATLLPMGSEPVVYAYVSLTDAFWPAIAVATVGNTLGGVVTYAMGLGVFQVVRNWRLGHPAGSPSPRPLDTGSLSAEGAATVAPAPPARAGGRWHDTCVRWLQRLGPKALIFAWLPAIGDPLCAVAGYLRFAFWPSVFYMALGKFLRYVTMTAALVWAWPLVP